MRNCRAADPLNWLRLIGWSIAAVSVALRTLFSFRNPFSQKIDQWRRELGSLFFFFFQRVLSKKKGRRAEGLTWQITSGTKKNWLRAVDIRMRSIK